MNDHIFEALKIANRLDWNILNCHDRALALASSYYNENVIWNFLMCHYSGTNGLKAFENNNYYGSKCYDYIADVSGLKFEKRTTSRVKLIDELTLCKEPCVLVINNYYRKGSKHYNKKSHPHFVFVHEIDTSAKKAEILDEIIENQYWKPENYKDGVKYELRDISLDDMLELTKETSKFANELGFDTNFQDNQSSYYYVVKKMSDCQLSPKEILLNEYKRMIETFDMHIEYVKGQLEKFSSLTKERYADFPYIDSEYLAQLNINDPTGIKTKLYFPYEWQTVEYHYRFLKRIVICEEYFLNSDEKKLLSLINRYELIKAQLCLFIMKKNYTAIETLITKFISLYKDEIAYLKLHERK